MSPFMTGTYHEDDQPSHLRIKPELENVPKDVSMQIYAAPETRFCPAGVYEYVNDGDKDNLVINAQVRCLWFRLLPYSFYTTSILTMYFFQKCIELYSLQVLQHQDAA